MVGLVTLTVIKRCTGHTFTVGDIHVDWTIRQRNQTDLRRHGKYYIIWGTCLLAVVHYRRRCSTYKDSPYTIGSPWQVKVLAVGGAGK